MVRTQVRHDEERSLPHTQRHPELDPGSTFRFTNGDVTTNPEGVARAMLIALGRAAALAQGADRFAADRRAMNSRAKASGVFAGTATSPKPKSIFPSAHAYLIVTCKGD